MGILGALPGFRGWRRVTVSAGGDRWESVALNMEEHTGRVSESAQNLPREDEVNLHHELHLARLQGELMSPKTGQRVIG